MSWSPNLKSTTSDETGESDDIDYTYVRVKAVNDKVRGQMTFEMSESKKMHPAMDKYKKIIVKTEACQRFLRFLRQFFSVTPLPNWPTPIF